MIPQVPSMQSNFFSEKESLIDKFFLSLSHFPVFEFCRFLVARCDYASDLDLKVGSNLFFVSVIYFTFHTFLVCEYKFSVVDSSIVIHYFFPFWDQEMGKQPDNKKKIHKCFVFHEYTYNVYSGTYYTNNIVHLLIQYLILSCLVSRLKAVPFLFY